MQVPDGKISGGISQLATPFTGPSDIANILKRTVRGQDHAIEIISVAAYDHLVRSPTVKKGNVLIVGPTGTGKTVLSRRVSQLIGIPYAEAKLTGTSATGYKGSNLSGIFTDLHRQQENPAMSRALLFLDEIDKITKNNQESHFGQLIQDELIGWVESATVKVPLGNEEFSVDTTNMLFVAAGAFVGLEEHIAKRECVDLGKYDNGDRRKAIVELYERMTPEDLISYGMKSELVGRFPYLTFTKPLSREILIEILTTGEQSTFSQQLSLLRDGYGVNVHVNDKLYGVLADVATHLGTGARGLESATLKMFTHIKSESRRGSTIDLTPELAKDVLKNLLPSGYST